MALWWLGPRKWEIAKIGLKMTKSSTQPSCARKINMFQTSSTDDGCSAFWFSDWLINPPEFWGIKLPEAENWDLQKLMIFLLAFVCENPKTEVSHFSTKTQNFPKPRDGELNGVPKCKHIHGFGWWHPILVRMRSFKIQKKQSHSIFFTSVCVGKFWTLSPHISTKTHNFSISSGGELNGVLKCKKFHDS